MVEVWTGAAAEQPQPDETGADSITGAEYETGSTYELAALQLEQPDSTGAA